MIEESCHRWHRADRSVDRVGAQVAARDSRGRGARVGCERRGIGNGGRDGSHRSCAASREAMSAILTLRMSVVLATPVLPILDWMERLAPVMGEGQLVTDVGSTKREIVEHARKLFNQPGRARFLPGHPMAGKESGGAGLAEAGLFRGAAWLFTPVDRSQRDRDRARVGSRWWRGLGRG